MYLTFRVDLAWVKINSEPKEQNKNKNKDKTGRHTFSLISTDGPKLSSVSVWLFASASATSSRPRKLRAESALKSRRLHLEEA